MILYTKATSKCIIVLVKHILLYFYDIKYTSGQPDLLNDVIKQAK